MPKIRRRAFVLSFVVAFLAGVIAGAINSVAGGGTLLSYPVLTLGLGLEPKLANTTNTIALWPASLAGAYSFRATQPPSARIIWGFLSVSILGGIVGAVLLKYTPEKQFEQLVPWLILMAAVLFLAQDHIQRRLGLTPNEGETPTPRSKNWWLLTFVFQFFVAIYGAYFGAGIGIMMLAALSLMQLGDIYRMQFLKNAGATAINGIGAILFIAWGMVHWPAALSMAAGAAIGGYAGAGTAKKIGPRALRILVSAIGFTIAAVEFYKQFRR